MYVASSASKQDKLTKSFTLIGKLSGQHVAFLLTLDCQLRVAICISFVDQANGWSVGLYICHIIVFGMDPGPIS